MVVRPQLNPSSLAVNRWEERIDERLLLARLRQGNVASALRVDGQAGGVRNDVPDMDDRTLRSSLNPVPAIPWTLVSS